MSFECVNCGYVTKRKLNFQRHITRKFPCNKTSSRNEINEIESNQSKKVDMSDQKNIYTNSGTDNKIYTQHLIKYIHDDIDCYDVKNDLQSLSVKTENCKNMLMKYICEKCNKHLCNKQALAYHLNICKGVSSKTCPICHKSFTRASGKYRHMKNVKCAPAPPSQSSSSSPSSLKDLMIKEDHSAEGNTLEEIDDITEDHSINNNIYNTFNNNNITNNITNVTNHVTNNIHINVFGNEDLSYLLEDSYIINRLKSFGKSGIYGLPKIINDVHFNVDKPENTTIIKPDEFGDGVLIKNDENQWEYREFEDIRDDLINTIVKYFKAYNIVKKKLGIRLVEKKERNIIKKIACELMSLDGKIPDDLLKELDIDELNDIEEDDERIKDKTRKFDKTTMKNMYYKTSANFKKEAGNFVKKTSV